MVKFNDLLNLRLRSKENENKAKMTALAEKSAQGSLSSFSGVFKLNTLNEDEKENLSNILQNYKEEEKDVDIEKDLLELITITSEVKAITNQAVILHGERVKKAQKLLKNYKEGAFTTWLMTTYGNRQTPYNFLQYYDFYMSMPTNLRPRIDSMPRQAIYTLASRSGDIDKKQDIVKNYQGQPKQELLSIIRKLFPLADQDKRQPDIAEQIIISLRKLKASFSHPHFNPNEDQKNEIKNLFEMFNKLI
ncbi:MAG: CT583 family protein [Parachlamydiales bacterium]|nr:CT583 family protein [Parachlamydiales bacterium]